MTPWRPFERLWLIGCGNMAGAMLARWLAVGMDPATVTVVRPSGAAVAEGVRVLTDVPRAEPPPDALLLGVKPQTLDSVAGAVAAAVGPETLLISILAGVEGAALRTRFPAPLAIVRAMPNTPVAIGKGVIALHGSRERAAEALMAPLGLVEWIADEADFGLVTALAGSGPAFLFRFVDALTTAAAELGLEHGPAARLALATVEGAAALAAASDETVAALADRVASPGGSTRKGLDVLDAGGALAALLRETLDAVRRRNAEMAAAARR